MSKYNKLTKDKEFNVSLVMRNYNDDESEWEIELLEPIFLNDGRFVKAGATFTYFDELTAEEEDVITYIQARGILDACNITDGDFEYTYLFEEGE